MAVTIKDVAKRAGVNASTVSRVLRNNPAISEQTKIKVRKAMQDLGYTRNVAAQMLASGKTNSIGVVFPPVFNKANQPFFMKILTAINEKARENEISVAIATGHSAEELEQQVRLMYSEKRVDGFIVLYAGKTDSVRKYLLENQVPFVLIGTPSSKQNEITYVDNDNKLLGREAVQYLYHLGHEQLAFVTDTTSSELYRERYQGFKEEIEIRNLNGHQVKFEKNKEINLEEATGLVVMDDVLALQVVESLQEQGCKVPDDVSVVSYNNSIFSEIVHPYLTTFDINIERLGHVAVEKFVNLTSGKEKFREKVIVPFELVKRESTKKLAD